jgi:hypothetical protein
VGPLDCGNRFVCHPGLCIQGSLALNRVNVDYASADGLVSRPQRDPVGIIQVVPGCKPLAVLDPFKDHEPAPVAVTRIAYGAVRAPVTLLAYAAVVPVRTKVDFL